MNTLKLQSLLMLACLIPGAICQAAGTDGYDIIPVNEAATRWGAIGIAIVFLLVVAVIAFKNAKRTHLD